MPHVVADVLPVYKDLIISTIVDPLNGLLSLFLVYKDLIISTIVDCYHGKQDIA